MQISQLNTVAKKKNKQILHDINIDIKAGEILAILGPNGSGKTVLLDYIIGDTPSGLRYSGKREVLNNATIKYVAQELNLNSFFTVEQYLDHYVTLNYGASITKEQRKEVIDQVIQDTGLVGARKTKVGDVFFKGLSGGEKRRLSIALELVAKPDILILDEPTSGLDSLAALQIVQMLKNLAKSGICVVATLHQPASDIWTMLDKVLIMSAGKICYHGPIDQCKTFFEHIGNPMKPKYNPADYYLEIVNNDFQVNVNITEISQQFINWRKSNPLPEQKKEEASTTENKFSQLYHLLKGIKGTAGGCAKFFALMKRHALNLVKNPGILGIRLVMYMMLSLMVGLMYLNLDEEKNHKGVIARAAMLYYVDAFLVFMSIAALPFFMIERSIIKKETQNQLYNPFYYQIAQFLTYLPGIAVIALVSSLFVVLIPNLNGFGIFFLTLFLSLVVAEGLAVLMSLLVPHYIIGMALVAGCYGMFMLCQGFFKVKDDIPGYFIWVYYLAFHSYSYEAFMYNEFKDIGDIDSASFPNGDAVLRFFNMEDTEIWEDMVILIAFAIAFQLLIFIVMKLKYGKKNVK